MREGEVVMKDFQRIRLALERVLLASALVRLARDVIELLSTVINYRSTVDFKLGFKVRTQAPRKREVVLCALGGGARSRTCCP